MFTNKVSALMGAKRENIKQMADGAGIAYGTAYMLYHDRTKRIDFDTIERLCQHFGVNVGDLFEVTPGADPTAFERRTTSRPTRRAQRAA